MISLKEGDLVTFYGQYWLGLGFEAVSETVSDEKYTAEFVFMHLNDCMVVRLFVSISVDNWLIYK